MSKSYPELQIYSACSDSFIPTPHEGGVAEYVFILTLALLLVYREDEVTMIVDK